MQIRSGDAATFEGVHCSLTENLARLTNDSLPFPSFSFFDFRFDQAVLTSNTGKERTCLFVNNQQKQKNMEMRRGISI